MSSITLIKLGIAERLRDPEFSKVFFRTQAADRIAISIRSLREKREKRQVDLANESGMLQSAVSRIEQANYGNWTLKTLFRVADVLGARLRVEFDPIEEVIEEYQEREADFHAEEQSAIYRMSDVSGIDISGSHLAGTTDDFAIETRQPGAVI